MNNRGVYSKGKIKIQWSDKFSYAIGLIATDGSLSKDCRHIDFTSKDIEQIKNYQKCLGIKNAIGIKNKKNYHTYRIQFGSVEFYSFLLKIGLSQAKSFDLGQLKIPNKYFFSFLLGVFDGDGYSYSYFDKRWKSSFMFYVCFCSASERFIFWIRKEIKKYLNLTGHITFPSKNNSCYQLKYAKNEAILLVKKMYNNKTKVCLSRKRLKIAKSLYIIKKLNKDFG